MRIPRRLLALALVSGAVGAALPAGATVVLFPEMPELVTRAEVIVHGTVTAQRVVEDGGRLWTQTTLVVKDGLKGAKEADTLVIHQLGGQLGDRQMWIPGAHRFTVGEELVMFGARFAKGGAAAVIPFGVGYGVFDVVADGDGRLLVNEVIGNVVAYRQNPDGTRSQFSPTPRSWPTVEAFKDEIRGHLTASRAGVRFDPPKRLLREPKVRGGAQ